MVLFHFHISCFLLITLIYIFFAAANQVSLGKLTFYHKNNIIQQLKYFLKLLCKTDHLFFLILTLY